MQRHRLPWKGKSMSTSTSTVAHLVEKSRTGEPEAISKLFPIVYEELRGLAAKYLRRERYGQSLQATALVNEAFLRLVPDRKLEWNDRVHFCGIAARAMRQILVERARARQAKKRGGPAAPVTLSDEILGQSERSVDLLSLDEALNRLAELDLRQAQMVELRFFGGLTVEETAEALGVSPATVKRWWAFCRAWLRRELKP